MKKGQVYEGIVEKIDFPNKGIVIVDNEKCVVKNALPGQKVRFLVNKLRKGKAEGRLVRTDEVSALECGSPCPHFGICGGCTYISLPYEEQLKEKQDYVRKTLKGICGVLPIIGMEDPYHYRNKVQAAFYTDKKGII